MLAKIATVLVVLFAILTAPVIVSKIDATPEREQTAGDAPMPLATATPYPLADDSAPRPGLQSTATSCTPWIDAVGVAYCFTPPPLPTMEGYPAP